MDDENDMVLTTDSEIDDIGRRHGKRKQKLNVRDRQRKNREQFWQQNVEDDLEDSISEGENEVHGNQNQRYDIEFEIPGNSPLYCLVAKSVF